MANCNEVFEKFNQLIKLDETKRSNLRVKRNNLRERVHNGFGFIKSIHDIYERIEFQSQGSYVMDTIINPSRKNDEYDIDDGVYFIGSRGRRERPEPDVFHQFIVNSISRGKGVNEIEEIIEKDTCVRVRYKGKNGDFNYHVDIPIYYAQDVYSPDLAHKKDWWHTSNPVEFILWFEDLIQSGFEAKFILERSSFRNEYEKWRDDRRKKDHQLRKIVRYMKAWGDYKKGDMPPGVVMTILAGTNYVEDSRDDISLYETLSNSYDWLIGNGFKCPRPTTPVGEDLFKDYSPEKKRYFKNALKEFIDSAKIAIQQPNSMAACREWKNNFGDRFPCHVVEDKKDYSSLSTVAAKSDMWRK
ncbi:CBASS cGAMP synthase [uncultured Draconibacterium sp.]|uniref:CBASS cGAMP synthase n=1 Tax=uncultured Draconibacterium sp. TaxID=1573823 RepID=UPI003217E4A7